MSTITTEQSPNPPATTGFPRTRVSSFNAWFFSVVTPYANSIARRHKRSAFAGIDSGHVLEIGAGTGANFGYVPKDCTFTALEPSSAMHARLRRKAEREGIDMRLIAAPAERIPLPDRSVDTVMISLVLCTVTDPHLVLSEIKRVLRPGGSMRVVEHVIAPSAWSPRRWLQRSIAKPWAWLFEGCRLCRDTETSIRSAGFSSVEVQRRRFSHSLFIPVNSAIHGTAVK